MVQLATGSGKSCILQIIMQMLKIHSKKKKKILLVV